VSPATHSPEMRNLLNESSLKSIRNYFTSDRPPAGGWSFEIHHAASRRAEEQFTARRAY
jgi:hypothetical protein